MNENMNEIVKLAVDSRRGCVEKYSKKQSQEALRQALIEANGGSTKLDYKAIRDGKCPGLFSLVEAILSRTVVDGFTNNAFFNAVVDFRNVAEGDKNAFVANDANLFVVDEAARGTQGVRRQRLGGESVVEIPTTVKIVRIYEELDRVLSGRIDFDEMIDRVSESFSRALTDDVYKMWSTATAEQLGGTTYFPVAGTYDEDALLDLIAHVEAAAGGKTATIVGTKAALRPLKMTGIDADADMYNMGYCGKFYGSPVVALPQMHKPGTDTFALLDNSITIIAGDDKPLKVVYEGDPLIIPGNPLNNADLTQEFVYGEKWGTGIVLAGGNAGIGRYDITK